MTERKKQIYKWFSFQKMFWVFFLIAFLLALFVAIFPNNDTAPITSEKSMSFNDGWTLENTGEVIHLPYYADAEANESVIISKTLPPEIKQMVASISFVSSLQSVKVEVGGKVLYEYCQNPDVYFDVQPPPAWHIIRIAPELSGQTIRITYSSPYKSFAGVLNDIQIGSKYANVSSMIGSRLLSMALCFTIFIFGLFAILLCLFTHNRIAELNRLLYLGIASVLISVWSVCETKVMQLFTDNVQLIMFLTFLCIMLFPIALLLFFKDSFSGRIRKLYNGMLITFGIYFVAIVSLQIFSIKNFNDFFICFLILGGVILAIILITVIREHLKNRTTQTGLPVLAVFFLFVFAMIDLYRFLFGNLMLTSYSDTSLFTRIGILLMISTLGYSSVKQILIYYSESTKAEVYKIMSQTDSMSGLKNRAYLKEIYPSVFQTCTINNDWISVIMMDIDNFKDYNDHYGHSAGDDAIQAVSKALRSFESDSSASVIRYGGEEFLFLLPQVTPKEAEALAQKIKKGIASLQIPHEYSITAPFITISQGIYSAVPALEDSLEQFIDFADKALYQAKKNQKNGYAVYEQCAKEQII